MSPESARTSSLQPEAIKEAVRHYFEAKAGAYDDVVHQAYWRLSDALLWHAVRQVVLPRLPASPHALDAGGGTGRWSERLLMDEPDATAVVFDLTDAMLAKARERSLTAVLAGRLNTVQGDLDVLPDHFPPASFDLVLCFHNVLGFVTDPTIVLRHFAALLRPGSHVVLVVPNRYHMAYFALTRGQFGDARQVMDGTAGRFTPDMPAIHTFTPAEIRQRCTDAALKPVLVAGFPCLLYPGMAETRLRGNSRDLASLLDDPTAYESILATEKALLDSEEAAARGNNLLVVATGGGR